MKDSHSVFYVIGFVTVLLICAALLVMLIAVAKDWFDRKIFKYRYKHRFDKPPTAKCYCKDCSYHGDNEDPSMCKLPGMTRYTPMDGFCYEAEPMTYEETKKRSKTSK